MIRPKSVLLILHFFLGVLAPLAGQDRVSPLALATGGIEFPVDADPDDPLSPQWFDWNDLESLDTFETTADSRETVPMRLPTIVGGRTSEENSPLKAFDASTEGPTPTVANASGWPMDPSANPVRRIPSVIEERPHVHRIVRYDVPLTDLQSQQTLDAHGIEGELIEIPFRDEQSSSWTRFRGNIRRFIGLEATKADPQTTRVIRYEVPADQIDLHTSLHNLDSEILEPGMLRLPEVRFFQPKARVFMDLKKSNDDQFDLFTNGAILASLDIVELYFPMPLISDRFARTVGKSSQLSKIGWPVGGTIGLGISTALNNGGSDNGSAPISTLASGIRYEFPLGRPSRELIETGDSRFDQRTRVGIETGFQGGISTDESLEDSTDVGFYFGILVNTPWTSGG